jgi:hypothetical protein
MVNRPALKLHLLSVLKAYLAINHVSGRMISGLSIAYTALRTRIVPELDIGLPGDYFHSSNLLAFCQRAPYSNHRLYGAPERRAKQNMKRQGKWH